MADKETMKSKNEAVIAGRLKQVNLEKRKDENKTTGAKEDVIGGSIVVQYGDKADQQVEVKIYKKKLTSSGSVAKAYEKLSDLIDNHTLVGQEGEATTVKIFGNGDFCPEVKLNEYVPEGGEYSAKPEVSMGFGNIAVDNVDEKSFKAQFDMVLFLTKAPKMELNKSEDETGRLIIEGLCIDYNNAVKPLSFVVEDEDVVEGMSGLEKGQTVEIWGDIKVARISEVKEKKSGFGGKAKTDETVTTLSELIITGGEEVEDSDKRYIEPSFVKKALVERETFLQELSKPKDKGAKKQGFDKTKKSTTDIPF